VGSHAHYPLVDSGRGKAGVEIAKAQAEQAALFYRRTILLPCAKSPTRS